jgi:3-isopropylmalate/(R)-2-methylmalate dehydratase small subunit
VVISSFFADIFRSNALNNFLLPVQISEASLHNIFKEVQNNTSLQLIINVEAQTVSVDSNTSSLVLNEQFDINSYKKKCILNGYDDIDFLFSLQNEIKAYEATSAY